MKFSLLIPTSLITLATVAACDYNVTLPSPVTNVNNNIVNTNTNTNSVDIHDLVPLPNSSGPVIPGNGTPIDSTVLPIPIGSESIAKAVADNNFALISKSCQATDGADAWKFLDLLVGTLRVQDSRWGYVCKDASCSTISQDTVGYRATTTNIGTWVVDVIGNHCGLPNLIPAFTWNVTGYESTRTWKSGR